MTKKLNFYDAETMMFKLCRASNKHYGKTSEKTIQTCIGVLVTLRVALVYKDIRTHDGWFHWKSKMNSLIFRATNLGRRKCETKLFPSSWALMIFEFTFARNGAAKSGLMRQNAKAMFDKYVETLSPTAEECARLLSSMWDDRRGNAARSIQKGVQGEGQGNPSASRKHEQCLRTCLQLHALESLDYTESNLNAT